jgi:hypothetical protein
MTPNDIGKEVCVCDKNCRYHRNQLSNATYDIMLFKGDIHLDETHIEDEVAAKQVYTFPETRNYLLRIKNINASVEDLINVQ